MSEFTNYDFNDDLGSCAKGNHIRDIETENGAYSGFDFVKGNLFDIFIFSKKIRSAIFQHDCTLKIIVKHFLVSLLLSKFEHEWDRDIRWWDICEPKHVVQFTSYYFMNYDCEAETL